MDNIRFARAIALSSAGVVGEDPVAGVLVEANILKPPDPCPGAAIPAAGKLADAVKRRRSRRGSKHLAKAGKQVEEMP